ncbi:cytochrome b-c1 complex subunit 8 [Drosophila kikkawai]|uniref:Cytochrome b-c1 complex subunit 8 n=1 Tax=Drosophila kikkawai TaxID=30033 RepID=A0A6P4I6N5_DROKI|nr:cytochrome b-c1 complex subunit 8 [Drosophila kikkawai]XP_020809617.1 cytochrome b-c1 complex subunit 8 [Drosophila serrata]XP_020809618.1 cytochrome b-c1 complex subunit 8 [Drosophila serrata]XP_020809620.1 cytochrome b-c1 complex subunit 8 [Drosophila serrata]XP_020809621.1 cytochrome b-c1 complex subunit 8 [Drosophila serrata]KAH8342329.1 hypothetical protein KR059_002067 [Drosophila kikkawai]
MRLSSILNGAHFGNLAKVHGIVTYKLSPFEQRAFAGAISNGVPNMIRRFRSNVFIVAPPFILGYLIYDLTERKHHALARKNPADFENDE